MMIDNNNASAAASSELYIQFSPDHQKYFVHHFDVDSVHGEDGDSVHGKFEVGCYHRTTIFLSFPADAAF